MLDILVIYIIFINMMIKPKEFIFNEVYINIIL